MFLIAKKALFDSSSLILLYENEADLVSSKSGQTPEKAHCAGYDTAELIEYYHGHRVVSRRL